LAGGTPQASLDALLRSSAECNQLVWNPNAYNIMATRYKSYLNSYIDNAFSDGLNRLNYVCKAKTYLYKRGYNFVDVTGGFQKVGAGNAIVYNADNIYLNTVSANDTGLSSAWQIDMTGWTTFNVNAAVYGIYSSVSGRIGTGTPNNNTNLSLSANMPVGVVAATSLSGISGRNECIKIVLFSAQAYIYDLWLQ
jgi:hypothetical protein